MKLAEFSVKNSMLVNLISVFILVAGFFTLFVYQIRREAFPEVSYDIVIVTTAYPGAAPQEIEKLVTVPIEKEIKGVDGLEEFQSASLENVSSIMIKIDQDVKDKDKVVDDIQQAVDRVVNFPPAAETPVVNEITSGEIPIIQVALSGTMTETKLQAQADILEDILEDIDGVSSISKEGYRDKEIWVEVDPDKIASMKVSLEEIIQALRRTNTSIPAGMLRMDKEFSIRTSGEFHTIPEIENVVIRANDQGNWLRIKDVAKVNFSFEEEDLISKSYGSRSINVTVIKRASGDAIKIVRQVKKETAKFLECCDPSLKVSFINDISYYITRRLGVLKNNGMLGIILVCCVLMIFLNRRVAILTTLGLPIAFGATLAVMGIAGLSINLVTMFGLIIVLGMLVDDGIIIAENCSRYLEEGLSPREAAIKGTQEVIKPVTVTIITTIAAFAPLLFMEGMLGKFIVGIPLVVIIALLCSLFEAVVILPAHFSDFVRVGKKFKSRRELPWFKKLINFYERTVNKALDRRYLVFILLVFVLIGTMSLAKNMKFVLFDSEEGIEQFFIRAEVPVGINLYATDKLMGQIEAVVQELPKDELDAYTTKIGAIGETRFFDPYGKSGSHFAQVTVFLTPYVDRKRTVNEIMADLKQKTKDMEGFDKLYFEKEHAGPPVGKAVAVQIRGEEFPTLNEIAAKISSFLQGVKGVSSILSDYEVGRGQIRVIIDHDQAARTSLSVSEIAVSIRNAFRGGVATSIKPVKAEEEIDVLVRFNEKYRNSRQGFDKILVPNKFGNLIPLNKVAKWEDRTSVSRIKHQEGKRVVTVRADVDSAIITSAEANELLAQEFKNLASEYPGYGINYAGEQEENVRSTQGFIRAFALAAFLIFMILAANFNSLIQPLVVMLAIPFGLIGVIWAFFFHGYTLSFFMMMGIVGLAGIVVNDSIVLVEFINGLRRRGVSRRDSIVQAGKIRLRPVILTTITTALGLTPTAYGIWGGDPFLRPMALTIVWGIICATALTLVVLPCVYAIIDDIVLKLAGHGTVTKAKNNS